MAKSEPRQPPRLPLFDRLLRGDAEDVDRNAERAMRVLREAVRRDLEILFNTRPCYRTPPSELTELQRSVLSYGLPDLQSQRMATAGQQEEFRQRLEAIVRRFEPRFRDLSIEILSDAQNLDRTLRFRIHAVLETDADAEPVIYDTLLDPASRGLTVVADSRDA